MQDINVNKISFKRASIIHQDVILNWLATSHMQEFWDNSQEHKDDILNFIHGRKQTYFYGTTKYWVGYLDKEPYCFILSDQIEQTEQNLPDLHKRYLSQAGNTIALDFGIGNTKFLGQGLAAPTLQAFTKFYHENVDHKADTFFIDPDESNPRAIHVYQKAGFKCVGNFAMESGVFKGHHHGEESREGGVH